MLGAMQSMFTFDMRSPSEEDIFKDMSSARQRKTIDDAITIMKRIEQAPTVASKLAVVQEVNPLARNLPSGLTETQKQNAVDNWVDELRWKVCKFMRYSSPNRIHEAVPYLKQVLDRHESIDPNTIDTTPLLYYGVALSFNPGREQEVERAFSAPNISDSWATALWARGHWSRMLRALGRVDEAQGIEEEIRQYRQWHPYSMSQQEFEELVLDPHHDGTDFILGTKKRSRGQRRAAANRSSANRSAAGGRATESTEEGEEQPGGLVPRIVAILFLLFVLYVVWSLRTLIFWIVASLCVLFVLFLVWGVLTA